MRPGSRHNEGSERFDWSGVIISVQPRIRLWRSFDQRGHEYLGHVLRVDGTIGEERREFLVAVGKGAQAKHRPQAGDTANGKCVAVRDSRREVAEFYKVSGLKVQSRTPAAASPRPPPWLGAPPELPVYRARGHRRLSARTHDTRCGGCIWGCRMPVEMIIDHWNPGHKDYRSETFCYGPLSCRLYRAGPTRKVPGRKGMTWEEEDWVDEDATGHREPDE